MNKKNIIKSTFSYSLIQIGIWAYYAVILSFAGNYLKQFGVSDSAIGILLGGAAALSFILQIVFAELTSKIKKLTMLKLGIISAVVMLICSVSIMLKLKLIGIIAYFVACAFLQILPGIGNTIGMQAIANGSSTDYSFARSLGSLGYSAFAFITGIFVSRIGISAISFSAIVVSIILIIGLMLYSNETGKAYSSKPFLSSSFIGFFNENKRFFVILLGAVLLCLSHNLITCFIYQIMLYKGGNAAQQGLASAVSALVEIPIMLFFPTISKHIKVKTSLCFSAFWFAIKSFVCFTVDSSSGIILASGLQIFSWGLYSISSVEYVSEIIDGEQAARAQSYLASAAPIGAFFAMLSGGFVLEKLGVPSLLLLSTVFGLLGSVILLCTKGETRAKK